MVPWLPEVLIALIGAVGGVLAATLPAWLSKIRAKQQPSSVVGSVLTLELRKFTELRDSVDAMFKRTKADRFLVLFAFNGKDYMKFASAIYEQHKNTASAHLSVGAVSKYVHIDIDEEYRKMLKRAETEGLVTYSVSKMQPSLLKDIYEAEGVQHMKIAHLKRVEDFGGEERDLLIYCTVATHESAAFTNAESTYIRAFMSTIRNEVFEAQKGP